ncbi:MAG: hypothetical protein WAN20_23085, partial [Pseudonocardiaceae bacterium]
MLVRSRRRALAAAVMGALLSVAIAVPASAAPAEPQSLRAPQQLMALQGVMTVLDSRSVVV